MLDSYKRHNNVQGGQPRVTTQGIPILTPDSNAHPAQRAVQNGAHAHQQSSHGVYDAPVSSSNVKPAAAKPTDMATSKSTRAPRAPSNVPAASSDFKPPPTPATTAKVPAEASRSFPLQFGSINPGLMNGMQVPARTSSAPPNLDEQKRDQGMMRQGQTLKFTSQMGPQLAPQLGNISMNRGPQFPQQQPGKFGGPRKTVKITHPETHEELKLDGSLRSHPNMIPQSQPISSFPPAHGNNYYPNPNSYNASSLFFPTQSSLPLGSSHPAASQPTRLYNQVNLKPAASSHVEKDHASSVGSPWALKLSKPSQKDPEASSETVKPGPGSTSTSVSGASKAAAPLGIDTSQRSAPVSSNPALVVPPKDSSASTTGVDGLRHEILGLDSSAEGEQKKLGNNADPLLPEQVGGESTTGSDLPSHEPVAVGDKKSTSSVASMTSILKESVSKAVGPDPGITESSCEQAEDSGAAKASKAFISRVVEYNQSEPEVSEKQEQKVILPKEPSEENKGNGICMESSGSLSSSGQEKGKWLEAEQRKLDESAGLSVENDSAIDNLVESSTAVPDDAEMVPSAIGKIDEDLKTLVLDCSSRPDSSDSKEAVTESTVPEESMPVSIASHSEENFRRDDDVAGHSSTSSVAVSSIIKEKSIPESSVAKTALSSGKKKKELFKKLDNVSATALSRFTYGMPRNRPDSERWQRGTAFQKGLMPYPQTPLQMMHKADKKYEVGKVTDEEQAKQRQLKGILNKLTPQNFEKLFEQVKQVNVDNAITLTGVISQIFDKALMDPTFCEMYANFCHHLAAELPDLSVDSEKITFKRLLLNKCQEEFERGEREEEEEKANKIEEEGEVKQTAEQREEKRLKARRRMLGNIRLIGELYKKKMLTERIMHECIEKLLGQYQNPDEENAEALCTLMSTIGEMIDHPKAKEHMDAYFDMMVNLSNNMKLSSRVRFMLKDVIDLRKNKWQQRRKVEGPKKIEEVHRDAAQERHAQATRLARTPSMGSSVRRGQTLDFSPRGSNILASPNSQMGGFRAVPPQLRGYGSQDARMDERHLLDNRGLSVPLPQRPLGDDSITLGPQGGLARGMSFRGQPASPGIPLDIPSSVDSRRMGAGLNGYNPTPDRSAYNAREELLPRHMSERFASAPAYDQPSLQERNVNYGSRDNRPTERGFDTSLPSSLAQGGAQTFTSNVPPEKLRDMSMATIKEFYSAKDENEVALCIKELNSPSFYPSMISLWVTDSFERKDMERDLLAKLLINLTKSHDSMLSQDQLIGGFESVLETLEDAVNDAPKAAEFLGCILAKIVLENIIPLHEIGRLIYEGGEEPGRLVEIGLAAEVLGTILEIITSERGNSVLTEIRSSSNLRLENFWPSGSSKPWRLDKFI